MEERTILESEMPPVGEATRVLGAPTMMTPGMAPAYGEATQQAIVVTCPVCGTPNGPGERYCQDCGLLFGSAPDEVEPLPDLSQLPRLSDNAGREFALNPGVNTVGRDAADILVVDPTVSRRHAQVTLDTGKVIVEDLGSTNGTKVGDRRLTPGERAEAYHGDIVKFGNILLTLQLPGGVARPEGAEAAPSAVPAAAEPAEDRGAPVGVLVLEDGTEFPLYPGVNTVGRRSGNQIVLADAFMSGKHAEITCEADGACRLVDIGSTNGSFLGAERLAPGAPVELADGVSVRLGKTAVSYRPSFIQPPTEPEAAEPPADTTLMTGTAAPPDTDEPAPGAGPDNMFV